MRRALVRIAKSLYPRESLTAAAATLGGAARVWLEDGGSVWKLRLEAPGRDSRAARRLLGELLNEALSHCYRQKIIRLNASFTRPWAAALMTRGFIETPPDPLEMLEPDIARARHDEMRALEKAAGNPPW